MKGLEGPVWLFCHPDLRGFYERRGFTFDPAMPYAMVERLSRYARSKPMIAMGWSRVQAEQPAPDGQHP